MAKNNKPFTDEQLSEDLTAPLKDIVQDSGEISIGLKKPRKDKNIFNFDDF